MPAASKTTPPPILLLCPPGDRVFHRDNYCSHEVKASYYWYPYDLVVQSALLDSCGPIEVLDATALRLDPTAVLGRLAGRDFRATLALTGTVCWAEDVAFLRQVAEITRAPLFVSGDVVRAHPAATLEDLPFVTGVLTDYTSRDLARHLQNQAARDGSLWLREQHPSRAAETEPQDGYSIGLPRWDLFPHRLHRMPFLKRRPFASVAASFGCPRSCDFCTAAPHSFKRRNVDDLFAELRHLAQRGYREIHFKDLSFGIDRPFYVGLLERLAREKLGFSFNCLARADDLRPDLVRLMKRAGCHLVHLGVESASERSLEKVHKGLSHQDVRAAIESCHREGIAVLASYVIGFPWERRDDVLRTIEFAVSLGADYASFNVFTARTDWPPTGREAPPAQFLPDYHFAEMQHRAYRRFYFRPSYIARQLTSVSGWTRLRFAPASGWELFKRHVWRLSGPADTA